MSGDETGDNGREVEFREAIRRALDEELERDERVIFFGEDVAHAGGVFQVTPGLIDTHGPDRVFDTPISELALTGAAFGSAVCGLRPVVEVMFADFLGLAMDSLVNQAAKYWYISNEQASIPLVLRTAVGGGGQFGAIHSQVPAPWFQAIPGLKIVAPATPNDARGLLRAAIQDDNPVLFLEHKRLYAIKGPLEDETVPLGSAAVVRAGRDISIITAMKGVHDALDAAATLEQDGIDAEVLDLRSLRPLDTASILRSVEHTNRVLIVEEGPETGGWAGEVLAQVTQGALEYLDDAWRLATPDIPVPYSPPLEQEHLPGAERIVETVRSRIGGSAPPAPAPPDPLVRANASRP